MILTESEIKAIDTAERCGGVMVHTFHNIQYVILTRNEYERKTECNLIKGQIKEQ